MGQKVLKDAAGTSEIMVHIQNIPDRIKSRVRKQFLHDHRHERHTIRLAD